MLTWLAMESQPDGGISSLSIFWIATVLYFAVYKFLIRRKPEPDKYAETDAARASSLVRSAHFIQQNAETRAMGTALGFLLLCFVLAGADMDCEDFGSRAEAQNFFESRGGRWIDLFNLDADDDGRVCETLP